MQGPFSTPAALAQALLRGPVTPERIRKVLWHAKRGTRAEFDRTLAALPPDVAVQVEAASAAVTFRG